MGVRQRTIHGGPHFPIKIASYTHFFLKNKINLFDTLEPIYFPSFELINYLIFDIIVLLQLSDDRGEEMRYYI